MKTRIDKNIVESRLIQFIHETFKKFDDETQCDYIDVLRRNDIYRNFNALRTYDDEIKFVAMLNESQIEFVFIYNVKHDYVMFAMRHTY